MQNSYIGPTIVVMNNICSICIEIIDKTNNVITECGHKFHTSCLIKNIVYNGFNCPNCHTYMANKSDTNPRDIIIHYDVENDYVPYIDILNEEVIVTESVVEIKESPLLSDFESIINCRVY